MSVNNYVNVAINIGGKTQTVKIEKGCLFENNGGQYVVDEKGVLNIFDKKTGQWKKTGAINMTQYQFNTFKAVANNTKEGDGITLSKNDILSAQDKFKKGQFTKDMSEFLGNSYHIENPKMSTNEKSVQVYVTNGNEGQSATLKFQIAELDKLKQASSEYQKEKVSTAEKQPTKGRATTVGKEAMNILDPDHDGKFKIDRNNSKSWNLPVQIDLGGLSNKDEKLLFDKLESLNGQKITPDLIDKITNILLDVNNPAKGAEINFDGEAHTSESMLFDFARFAQYLKPETLTKLLSEQYIVKIEENGDSNHSKNLKAMKNLYGRLTPKQKELYYQKILSTDANRHDFDISSWQSDGKALADYIFEKPVSTQNFNRIKTLVIAMNKPNGVAGTKDECKELINTLKAQGKITQAQAIELFKAGNIKS
ncbi:MAG: hypothetical protein ACI37Q_05740 [Candidatus Gastranaerophilaceae bacterium]